MASAVRASSFASDAAMFACNCCADLAPESRWRSPARQHMGQCAMGQRLFNASQAAHETVAFTIPN